MLVYGTLLPDVYLKYMPKKTTKCSLNDVADAFETTEQIKNAGRWLGLEEPNTVGRKNKDYTRAIGVALLTLAFVVFLLYAMHGDQQALNAGLIH